MTLLIWYTASSTVDRVRLGIVNTFFLSHPGAYYSQPSFALHPGVFILFPDHAAVDTAPAAQLLFSYQVMSNYIVSVTAETESQFNIG